MKTIKKITKLFIIGLLLWNQMMLNAQGISNPITVNGNQITVSPTLQKVLTQAESVYVTPLGYTLNQYFNEAPDLIPIVVGLIMQRQEMEMDKRMVEQHLDNALQIEIEIFSMLANLAKAQNYTNPNAERKVTPITLNKDYMDAINGNYNAVFISKFGIDPTKVNIPYLLDIPQQNSTSITHNQNNTDDNWAVEPQNQKTTPQTARGKLQIKKKKNEINLFDHVSGAADQYEKDSEVIHLWDANKPFSSSVIIGTWYHKPVKNKVALVVSQGENGYIGKINKVDYGYYEIWQIKSIGSKWINLEKKADWIEYYSATIILYSTETRKEISRNQMEFHISPYRETWVLDDAYKPRNDFFRGYYKPLRIE